MTPQLVDMNADGIQDMLFATFEGTAFLVQGSEEGWEAPKHIVDENDTNVRIAMYYDMEENEYKDIDRSTADYENNKGHHMTSVAAVDWDADGDLDLVLGAYEGPLYLCMNEGTAKEPKFAAQNQQILADGDHMTVESGLATPRIVDWNGDGLFDILCGGSKGGVLYFKNKGAKGKPEFAAGQKLITSSKKNIRQIPLTDEGLPSRPGTSFHIEAVDYDHDGDLDLLVGAQSTCVAKPKKLTEEEVAKAEELQEQIKVFQEKMNEMFADKEPEEMKELQKSDEFREFSKEYSEVFKQLREIQPSPKTENLIWLYRNDGTELSTTATDTPSAADLKITAPKDFDPAKFEVRAQLHRTGDTTAKLVVFVNVPAGFHIYGPKSEIEPTTLNVKVADGIELDGDANVPNGRVVFNSGKTAHWLENVVTITQDIKVAGDIDTVSGNVAYMICNEQGCRPPDEEKFTAKWVK